MRKDFNDCLGLIQSDKIRRFVKEALAAAPKEFWTAPCSGSGKYHPPEDQVEGGIIVHTRKGVQVVLWLCRFFNITNQLVIDKLIAGFILHDIKKNGEPWGEKTHPEHGLIAARWLRSVIEVALVAVPAKEWKDHEHEPHFDPDIEDIIELVKNHMGIWSSPEPTPALVIGKKLDEKSIWHSIVQLADYWASRKGCSFVCNEIIAD